MRIIWNWRGETCCRNQGGKGLKMVGLTWSFDQVLYIKGVGVGRIMVLGLWFMDQGFIWISGFGLFLILQRVHLVRLINHKEQIVNSEN